MPAADSESQQASAEAAPAPAPPTAASSAPAPAAALPLAGKRVVVTGTLVLTGIKRAEVEDAIRAMGGHPGSSVSGNTDLVVVGDKPGTNKVEGAKKYGVQLIAEADFVREFGNPRDFF